MFTVDGNLLELRLDSKVGNASLYFNNISHIDITCHTMKCVNQIDRQTDSDNLSAKNTINRELYGNHQFYILNDHLRCETDTDHAVMLSSVTTIKSTNFLTLISNTLLR